MNFFVLWDLQFLEIVYNSVLVSQNNDPFIQLGPSEHC